MPIDFSKFQKKDQDIKITPEKIEEKKIVPKEVKTEKQPQQVSKTKIDQKINDLINERLLNLVKLGLKHELTIDNMIQYFNQVSKSKLYELRRYFSDSSSFEIDRMLKYLHSSKVIKKDRNGWYILS